MRLMVALYRVLWLLSKKDQCLARHEGSAGMGEDVIQQI